MQPGIPLLSSPGRLGLFVRGLLTAGSQLPGIRVRVVEESWPEVRAVNALKINS